MVLIGFDGSPGLLLSPALKELLGGGHVHGTREQEALS